MHYNDVKQKFPTLQEMPEAEREMIFEKARHQAFALDGRAGRETLLDFSVMLLAFVPAAGMVVVSNLYFELSVLSNAVLIGAFGGISGGLAGYLCGRRKVRRLQPYIEQLCGERAP